MVKLCVDKRTSNLSSILYNMVATRRKDGNVFLKRRESQNVPKNKIDSVDLSFYVILSAELWWNKVAAKCSMCLDWQY